MGKIRSAWEIALEKTENIQVDREKLKLEEDIKKASRAAGAFLHHEENKGESLEDDPNAIGNDKAVREGVKLTVLQNITLPQDTVLADRYERLTALVALIAGQTSQAVELMGQITGFCRQYPEHRKQLIDQLKEQFAPMAEQKAAQLRAQYGQDVPVSLENDPEFLKLAQTQLDRLSKQYNDTLEGAKAQLSTLL